MPVKLLEAEVSRMEEASNFTGMLEAAKALHMRLGGGAGERIADAYGGRIRDLLSKGLLDEAAALLPLRDRHRNDGANVEEKKLSLYIYLRKGAWEKAVSLLAENIDPQLEPCLADLLVLYPESADMVDRDGRLASELLTVMEAFSAYDASDDDRALELLRGLGLKSPFRYWKLLIRGIIAFHSNELDAAAKNFRGIPSLLPVGDLADGYLLKLDPSHESAALNAGVRPVFKGSSSEEYVRDIAGRAAKNDFIGAARLLRKISTELPDQRELLKLCSLFLWHALVKSDSFLSDNSFQALKNFFKSHIPDDKNFSRTRAINSEHYNSWDESVDNWEDFARSAERGEVPLIPRNINVNRLLGQLCLHMAVNESKEEEDCGFDFFSIFKSFRGSEREDRRYIEELLEKSISFFPENPEPYLEGIRIAKDVFDDSRAASSWAERFVKAFPNNLQGLLAAADLAMGRDSLQKASRFLTLAEDLEPLHKDVREAKAKCFTLSARKNAKKSKWVLAAEDYASALKYSEGAGAQSRTSLLIEAGFFDLGRMGLSEPGKKIAEALKLLGNGPSALLQVVLAAKEFKLSRKLRKPYDDSLKKALAEPNPAYALELMTFVKTRKMPQLQEDAEALVSPYVERCAKANCSAEQALEFCLYFQAMDDIKRLAAVARRFSKTFPGDYHFQPLEAFACIRLTPRFPVFFRMEEISDGVSKALKAGDEPFANLLKKLMERLQRFIDFVDIEETDECGDCENCEYYDDCIGEAPSFSDNTFPPRSNRKPAKKNKPKKSNRKQTAREEEQKPDFRQLDLFGETK